MVSRRLWNMPGEGDSTPSLVCVPLLGHCTVKKPFLISRWNFLCMFVPIALVRLSRACSRNTSPVPQATEEPSPTASTV